MSSVIRVNSSSPLCVLLYRSNMLSCSDVSRPPSPFRAPVVQLHPRERLQLVHMLFVLLLLNNFD